MAIAVRPTLALKKVLTRDRLRYASAITGGILVHLSLGTLYTFGNIIPYVASYVRLRSHPATLHYRQTVWGFALTNVGFGIAMFLGGLMQRTIGPRWTTAIGGLVMSCGVTLTYFAVKASYYWFLVTYGLVFGVGVGIAYACPLQVSMQWMPKRKGLASGLIVAGFGGGAFIFNQIQTAYLNPDNLPPAIANASDIANALTIANASSFANVTDSLEPDEKYFYQAAILDRVPSVFLLLGGIYACMQMVGSLMLFSPDTDPVAQKTSSERVSLISSEVQGDASDSESTGQMQPSVPGRNASDPSEKNMGPLQMIRTRMFITLWFMFLCNQQVTMLVSSLYKAFGLSFVSDDKALAWLGTFAAVFNAGGRIVWGMLADRFSFTVAMFLLCGCMSLLMSALYWTQYATNATHAVFYVCVCLIFLCFSGNFSLFPSAIAQRFGTEHLVLNYGLLFTCTIVAGIVGAAVAAHLSGMLAVFSLGAALSAVSFLLLLSLVVMPPAGCGCCRST